jgi:hypothetical protein
MRDGHCTGDPNGCVMTPPAPPAAVITGPDWQPIDTAPQEGRILGWCVYPAGAEVRTCNWRKGAWEFHGVNQNVTHWLPVPEGPPNDYLRSTTKEEFIAHLQRISAEVRTWPMWKRSALGWVVVYPEDLKTNA